MASDEYKYYNELKNWDFSRINYTEENLTNWDMYSILREKSNSSTKVLDLGTGTGIVPILIAGKSQASKIIGVEIQEEVYEMATRSVKLNDLEERVEIVNADIKEIDKVLEVNGYHVVTSNPPYMHMDGIKNPNDKKAISRHEVKCNLEDVIRAASRLTIPRGKFFMIHRPIR